MEKVRVGVSVYFSKPQPSVGLPWPPAAREPAGTTAAQGTSHGHRGWGRTLTVRVGRGDCERKRFHARHRPTCPGRPGPPELRDVPREATGPASCLGTHAMAIAGSVPRDEGKAGPRCLLRAPPCRHACAHARLALTHVHTPTPVHARLLSEHGHTAPRPGGRGSSCCVSVLAEGSGVVSIFLLHHLVFSPDWFTKNTRCYRIAR